MSKREQLFHQTDKISQPMCSVENAAFKNFSIFTRKHLCWVLFLMKLPAFRPETLLEKDSKTVCFPFAKLLSRSILKNTSELKLESNCLELCFWAVAFKTINTRNTSCFQTRSLNTIPC